MSKIKKVNNYVSFPEIEKKILQFWKDENIFQKSLDQRENSPKKTFYDGPITANGMPHHGHMLTFAIKDLYPRYWTMKGFRVDRSLGWDCQGIPVEYEIEKKLGFKEKKDIEKFGVDKFNQLCRESVLEYRSAMITLEEKMGRLTNTDEEYATMDANYIESIWWSLKELYSKGLLYEGFKVVPYSTRAGTTLSNAEVALGGYKAYVDPAVTVKFELVDEPGTFILAWTTTPWTLPTNFGLAIGENIEYVKVLTEEGKYIVAKDCVKNYFDENSTVEEVKASELVGKEYKPLFNYFVGRKNCFKVYYGFHVTTESGTGVVHLAPYGAEDNEIFKEVGIESIDVLNDQGDFTELVSDFNGVNYRDANPKIIELLKEKGLLFKHEDYTHDMPMCWRTNTPLIYKPITSWYVAMSKLRNNLVEHNNKINWTPSHVKHGRFGNWLSEIKDWGISRLRYWGTPLPVWKSESGKTILIGSFEELKKYSGVDITDPHRPYIDDVKFEFEGETYTRIPDVLDVWYDSGAMPFARFHYPFENADKFKDKFPAEFIAEGIDQTRGWFYTLHALSTSLFDSEAFKNVVINGFILDDHGAKLSKSKKNYSSPESIFENFGADTARINFFSTPIVSGEDTTISDKTLRSTMQETMIPLWNIFSYLTTYAEAHNWSPNSELIKENSTEGYLSKVSNLSILDKWLIARLAQAVEMVSSNLDKYDIQKAIKALKDLIEDTSKWYIRRSRDRFVSGEQNALSTLYFVYMQTIKLLAPFTPFVSDEIYRLMVYGLENTMPESVHLTDYPQVETLDENSLKNMNLVREISSLGLNLRVENGIKLRQPLSSLKIKFAQEAGTLGEELLEIIKDELNVKVVELVSSEVMGEGILKKANEEVELYLDSNITSELREEGLLNELTRQIQNFRKESGLKMGEEVKIEFATDSTDLLSIISQIDSEIKKSISVLEFINTTQVEGKSLTVGDYTVYVKIV